MNWYIGPYGSIFPGITQEETHASIAKRILPVSKDSEIELEDNGYIRLTSGSGGSKNVVIEVCGTVFQRITPAQRISIDLIKKRYSRELKRYKTVELGEYCEKKN